MQYHDIVKRGYNVKVCTKGVEHKCIFLKFSLLLLGVTMDPDCSKCWPNPDPSLQSKMVTGTTVL